MLPHQIIQPTLRVGDPRSAQKRSDEKPMSTPKYLLKVPIPQLPGFQTISHQQMPSYREQFESGSKENNFSVVTFDQRRWNPESLDSGAKVLSNSGKKVNTEIDEASSCVEKSYSEAAQKILKIKTLELENKVSLLVIENERLTTFLNDQFQETEKLNQELQQAQNQYSDLQNSNEDKLNVILMDNDKLQSINKSLEAKVDQLMLQKKQLITSKDEEIKALRDEMAGKLQREVSTLDIKRKSELTQFDCKVEQLQMDKCDMEKLIQDQIKKISSYEQSMRQKELLIEDHKHLKLDVQQKVTIIEKLSETIRQQEERIATLDQRLDVMVTDNKQLSDVIEQLNQTQRNLQQSIEKGKKDFEKESAHAKEFYDKEIKSITLKHKQQLDDLKYQSQDSVRQAQLQVEEQMIQEMETLRIECQAKIYELQSNLVLQKEQEKLGIQDLNREIELKEQMIVSLRDENDNVKAQMEQLQQLMERMQNDFDETIDKKDQEIVKLTKQAHQKDLNTKQMGQKLDEICKQIRVLEEQRDELSVEITRKSDRARELEYRIDIVIKENETLQTQHKIANQQAQIQQQRYESLEKSIDKQIEDVKLQLNYESSSQIEQCITQYQETIKYEQERSQSLSEELKKRTDKLKHQELLNVQHSRDLDKNKQKIIELMDVCEQSGLKLQQLEDVINKKDREIEQLNERFSRLQSNYELEFETLKGQMNDIGVQNEDILVNFQGNQLKFNQLEKQYKKAMDDLTLVTKQKMDIDHQLKTIKQQFNEIERENKHNYEEFQKYKSQVHQHQQEVEEITRSCQYNYSEKEQEIQEKYDNTISDLRQQLNTVTNKYNDLARKERDNRFRLKLLKSNSNNKLPSELEKENCYETIKQKLEDQSEYIRKLIVENEELKQKVVQQGPSKQSSKRSSLFQNKAELITEDTERTIRHQGQQAQIVKNVPMQQNSTKKLPIKVIQNYNSPQLTETKGNSNRVLDRDVYLQSMQHHRTEPKLLRQQSLQRI